MWQTRSESWMYLQPQPIQRMTVIGNGSVKAAPNFAEIKISVISEGKNLQPLQQQNALIMTQIIEALLALNIPRENIQTVVYSIQPQYDFVDGKQQFRGYEIINTINVKIMDLALAGTVMDTAITNGANRISGLSFGIDNEEQYYKLALQYALDDALDKSHTISKTLRLSHLPIPIEIVEETVSQPVPMYRLATFQQATTPIEPGQMVIQASVRVTFQF